MSRQKPMRFNLQIDLKNIRKTHPRGVYSVDVWVDGNYCKRKGMLIEAKNKKELKKKLLI
jgi:hypothetical protein